MDEEFTDLQKQAIAISSRGTRLQDQVGRDTSAEAAAQNRSLDASTTDLIGRGFRSMNAAAGVAQWAERSFTVPDPDFDLNSNWDALTQGIPEEYKDKFNSVRSMEEGQMLRADIVQELEDQAVLGGAGARGMVAAGLASIIDVDLPLTFLSGGSYLAPKTAKFMAEAGLAGTKFARSATVATAGLEAGVLTQTANTIARPTGQWSDIPDAALGGLVFGGALGAVLPKSMFLADQQLQVARAQFEAAKAQGFAEPSYKPVRKDPVLDAYMKDTSKGDSVGAASMRTDQNFPYMKPEETGAWVSRMQKMNVDDGYTGDRWDVGNYFNSNPVSQAAKAVYRGVSKTLFASDFDRLFNAPGVLAPSFAARLLESPSGVGRMVNQTSANLLDGYTAAIQAPVAQRYRPAFSKWLKETKDGEPTELAWNDNTKRNKFDREVQLELAHRYHDGMSNPASSAAVREMADAVDEAASNAVNVYRGAEGETPAFGAETLEARPGWYRQVWSGANIQQAIVRAQTEFGAKDGRKLIADSLALSYRQLHGWNAKVANAVANAVISRALAHAEGANTSLFRTMNFEDGAYLREMLEGNNLDGKIVDEFMEHIKGKLAERGKNPALKHRNDIDPRTPIAGTDMTLMDLLDTDLEGTWLRYARTAAGSSALARNGIQYHELDSYLLAMNDEISAMGGKPFDQEFLKTLKTYFSGNAYGGGVNPNIRRLNLISRLSLLNGMGLTQLGELGNTIGMVHLDNFLATAGTEAKAVFGGKLLPAHEQLQYLDGAIIGDHLISAPHRSMDEMRFSSMGQPGELGNLLDTALARGARIQGYTSLFYKTNQWMQNAARAGMSHRLWKHANGKDTGFSDQRWADFGFANGSQERILKYFRDGTVEVKDGRIYSYHPEKWDTKDWTDFAAFLRRSSSQAVQKNFRGEDAWWMHKEAGSFLMHLKSFTFTALHKQLIRNMRLADPESVGTFFWGLGTAAGAFAARQYTSGNQEKLDGEKLVKGMLNYSSITSPVIQFSDPAMGILGLSDYQIGNFQGAGRMGASTDLLSMPAQFNVVNRLAKIPAAGVRAATGDMTSNDVYALQATPLVGNIYGMGYLANAMRADINSRKKEQVKVDMKDKEDKPPVKLIDKPSETPVEPKQKKDTESKEDSATSVDLLNSVVKSGGGQ
jgi:hypothetical protein